MAFSRIRPENQLFFIGTGQVFGIQDISVNNQFGSFPLKYIGIGSKSLNQTVNQQQYADLKLDSYLVNQDIFIQQTGITPINCFLFKTQSEVNNVYSLISGYLNNYSIKYSVNQIPQISSTFRFYNNAGYINTGNLDNYSFSQLTGISLNAYPPFDGEVADSNYINLSLNEYNTNRVSEFDCSIDINRIPIYNLGSRFPKRIDIIYPINISCDITFEADYNFTGTILTDFPFNKIQQNIEIDVFSNRTNVLMENYLFQNMTLVSENKSHNTNGNLTIKRNYVGQIFSGINNVTPINIWDFNLVISGIGYYVDFGYVNSGVTGYYDFGAI